MSKGTKKNEYKILKIWNRPLFPNSSSFSKNYDYTSPYTWSEIIAWLAFTLLLKYLWFDLDWEYSAGFSLKGIIKIVAVIFCLFATLGFLLLLTEGLFSLLNNLIVSKDKVSAIKKGVKKLTSGVVNETLFDGEKDANFISRLSPFFSIAYTIWFLLIFLIVPLGILFENTALFKFLWTPFQVLNTIFLIYFFYLIFSIKVYRNLFFVTLLIIILVILIVH